jgi:hypothetical protein
MTPFTLTFITTLAAVVAFAAGSDHKDARVCLEYAKAKQVSCNGPDGNVYCTILLDDGRVIIERQGGIERGPICAKWGEK